MNQAKARITPRAKTSKPVTPKAPAPKVQVDVAAAQIIVDTEQFATVLNGMAKQINVALTNLTAAMAATDARLVDIATAQKDILQVIEKGQKEITLDTRPDNFYVEFDQEDGDTVGLRISSPRMDS